MNIYKIFGLVLLMLTIVNSANAITTASYVNGSYYTYDAGSLLDSTGNGKTLTNAGSATTNSTWFINESFNFDGSSTYMERTNFHSPKSYTYSFWFYTDSLASIQYAMHGGGTVGDSSWATIYIPSDGSIHNDVNTDGGGVNLASATGVITTGTDLFVVVSWEPGNQTIYVNDVLVASATSGNNLNRLSEEITIGSHTAQIGHVDGSIDEIGMVINSTLSRSDISDLYNSGNGFQYPFVEPAAPTIFTNITAFYNTTPINVSLNTSVASNYSYSLNNASLISILNDTTNASVLLTPVSGLNNISWRSENEDGVTWTNETFTLDLIDPILINNLPSEFNNPNLTINLDSSITVTDSISGIFSCFVNFSNGQNPLCNNTAFVFAQTGNLSYNISVRDNAGNTNFTSSVILVSPNQTLRFNNTFISTFISGYELLFDNANFTFTGTNASIPLFDLPIGVNNFTFIKFGFNQTEFDITTTNASVLDEIFQVAPVTLVMTMFNSSDTTEQLTFNTTIFNSTFSINFVNQLNFQEQFSDLPSGDITILVDSVDFAQAKFFNTITAFTAINITGFLIPDALVSTVTFEVRQFGSEILLDTVLIEAQQLVNGSFQTVSQAITDESGTTFILLDASEEYKFIFTKDGFVSGTTFAIPGVTSYFVTLRTLATAFGFIDGISYLLLPTNSILITNLNHSFSGFLSGTGLTFMSLTLTSDNGTVLFTDNSTNPTGTTFATTLELLNSTSIISITADLSYVKDSVTNSIIQLYTLQNITNGSIIAIAKNFNNDESEDAQLGRWFIMIITIAGSVLVGRIVGVNTTGAGLMIIPVVYLFNSLNWMPLNYAFTISLAAGVFFLGGRMFR